MQRLRLLWDSLPVGMHGQLGSTINFSCLEAELLQQLVKAAPAVQASLASRTNG